MNILSFATAHGFPYLRGEGRGTADGEVWLSRFTRTADGTGAALFAGWDHKRRRYVMEKEPDETEGA